MSKITQCYYYNINRYPFSSITVLLVLARNSIMQGFDWLIHISKILSGWHHKETYLHLKISVRTNNPLLVSSVNILLHKSVDCCRLDHTHCDTEKKYNLIVSLDIDETRLDVENIKYKMIHVVKFIKVFDDCESLKFLFFFPNTK